MKTRTGVMIRITNVIYSIKIPLFSQVERLFEPASHSTSTTWEASNIKYARWKVKLPKMILKLRKGESLMDFKPHRSIAYENRRHCKACWVPVPLTKTLDHTVHPGKSSREGRNSSKRSIVVQKSWEHLDLHSRPSVPQLTRRKFMNWMLTLGIYFREGNLKQ